MRYGVVIVATNTVLIDADNEDDFRVLAARFEEWIHLQPVNVTDESF